MFGSSRKIPQQAQITDEQKAIVKAIAESIAQLEDSEGWKHFVRTAEAMIERETPRSTSFNADSALEIASKITYINGIRACLDIVRQQKAKVKELEK